MSEQHETQFPKATEHSQIIENRRAILRQALNKTPDDARVQDALRQLLQPPLIRRAAKRGVFICYSRDDELFALDLTTDLREGGVRAFMDEIDIPDDLSQEWGQVVGTALRGCGVLVLVLSPSALHDAEVQGERIYFLKTGKVVIAVTARHCHTHGLEMVIPPIDFEADYHAGLRQLLHLLAHSSEASA